MRKKVVMNLDGRAGFLLKEVGSEEGAVKPDFRSLGALGWLWF